jgi:hypothetical protein
MALWANRKAIETKPRGSQKACWLQSPNQNPVHPSPHHNHPTVKSLPPLLISSLHSYRPAAQFIDPSVVSTTQSKQTITIQRSACKSSVLTECNMGLHDIMDSINQPNHISDRNVPKRHHEHSILLQPDPLPSWIESPCVYPGSSASQNTPPCPQPVRPTGVQQVG